MRHRRSLQLGAAALAALAACDASTAPDDAGDSVDGLGRQPSFLLGSGDSARVVLPDTIAVNGAATIVVPTAGGGCVREGDTEVAVSGLAADVRPYDYFPTDPGTVCTADFRELRHTATLRFTQTGRATVRVHGRTRPDRAVVVTRTVVVR